MLQTVKFHGKSAVIKTMNRWTYLLGFYLATLFLGGVIFKLVEEGKTRVDGWWWAFITSTSIGYGDHFPITGIGRMTGVVVAIVGIWIVIPAIVVLLLQTVIKDMDKLTDLEQRLLIARAEAGEESDKVLVRDNEILFERQTLIMAAILGVKTQKDISDIFDSFMALSLPSREHLYERWEICEALERQEQEETQQDNC